MWPVHGMAVSILLYLSNNSTSWLWNWRIPSVLKLLFSQVAAVVQEYDRLLAFWLRDSDTRDENSENSVNWHWTKAENERLKEDGPKDSLKAKPGENAEEFWAVRNMEKTWSTLAHSSVVKQSCAIQRELWKRQALQPELFLMNKLNCSTQRFFWFQTLISLEVQFFQRAEISKFSQYLHIFTFLKQKSYNERHWQLKLCTMNLFRKLEMRRCRSLGCRCRRSLVFPKLVEVGKRSPLEFEFRYWISWLLSCASQLSTAETKVRFRKKKHGKIQQICRIFCQSRRILPCESRPTFRSWFPHFGKNFCGSREIKKLLHLSSPEGPDVFWIAKRQSSSQDVARCCKIYHPLWNLRNLSVSSIFGMRQSVWCYSAMQKCGMLAPLQSGPDLKTQRCCCTFRVLWIHKVDGICTTCWNMFKIKELFWSCICFSCETKDL